MTPERILEAMTTGSMRTAAARVSDQDKRLIAEWVAGRKLDTDLVGAAEKMPNTCASHPQVRESNAPAWNGWGVDYRNSRFQPAASAGLSPGQVSRLQLKWAFGFPGATALYGQTVHDGRLYVTSNAGYVYSLDAETGCLHWGFRAQSAVRSGFTIGRLSKTDPRLAIFFGDIHGTAYALSASTGEEIWKTLTDPHPLARITGTPVLFEGRLYVPVASLEEPESGQADYACCTFRGYHVGARCGHRPRDLEDVHDSGSPEGRRQELARQEHARAGRRRHLGDADARRQAARAVRHDRQRLLGHAENSQRGDGDEHRHRQSAVVDAGARHSTPGTTGVCRTFPAERFPPASGGGGRGGRAGGLAIPYPPENCPAVLGPDWDFAAPAALATTTDGRDILIAPQKQGLVWAINPDNGQVIWKQDVAREIAGGRGETLFGGAVDSEKAYFGLISSGHLALDLKTGEEVWYAPLVPPQGRENQRGVVGAVTLIPGVLLSGARDGMIRAASSRTGQLLWEFDSAKEFTTVNGVTARGGSAASGGPVVANGMVFIGSGYPGFQGGQPGNVLLAFAPPVRLDVHADELKRKAAGTPDGR